MCPIDKPLVSPSQRTVHDASFTFKDIDLRVAPGYQAISDQLNNDNGRDWHSVKADLLAELQRMQGGDRRVCNAVIFGRNNDLPDEEVMRVIEFVKQCLCSGDELCLTITEVDPFRLIMWCSPWCREFTKMFIYNCTSTAWNLLIYTRIDPRFAD